MILERLYRPNTFLVRDPETGCLPEAVELAREGESMINKAKASDGRAQNFGSATL